MFNLFKKSNLESVVKFRPILQSGYEFDKSKFINLLSASLGRAMAIQTAASDIVVKEQDWNIDFEAGLIKFGSDTYKFSFLGSESEHSNTWMWGFNNINGFDESLLEVAKNAKIKGEIWGVSELVTEQFELTDAINGHTLATVACGLSEQNLFYYRCPYDDGAAFIAVLGAPEDVFASLVNAHKVAEILIGCIERFELEHKILIESFLAANGTPYERDGDVLVAHFDQDMRVEFERVSEIYRVKALKIS